MFGPTLVRAVPAFSAVAAVAVLAVVYQGSPAAPSGVPEGLPAVPFGGGPRLVAAESGPAGPVAGSRASPVVNPQFSLSSFSTELPGIPNVAASSSQFLLLYADFALGPAQPVLKARLVGVGGTVSNPLLLTDPKVDHPLPFTSLRSQAASDGTDFLAVWNEQTGGLYGAIVKSDGTLKTFGAGNATRFLIAQTTAKLTNELPLVAYNGEQYVVAWHDKLDANTRLYYALVAADGSGVSGTKTLGPSTTGADRFLYLLSAGPDYQVLALSTDFLAVPPQVHAQRIDRDGSNADPNGIKLFNIDPVDFGFGQPTGVRAAGSAGWQILSTTDQTVTDAIYLHELSADGVFTRADELDPVSEGVFARMGVGPIGLAGDDSLALAASGEGLDQPGGGSGAQWLFVRNLADSTAGSHFLARRVGEDGTEFDRTPFQIDDGDNALRRYMAVACASGSKRYFVAWLEGGPSVKSGVGDILQGVLLDPAGDADASLFTRADLEVSSLPRPIHVPAGTEVGFDWSASTGPITKQTIYFGDAKRLEVPTGTFTQSHLYKVAGVYVASIDLQNGSYHSSDQVVITVGGGTGVEGADEVVGGAQGIVDSTGQNSVLLVQNVKLFLDFAAPLGKKDSLVISGDLDLSKLPFTRSRKPLAGKLATVSIFGPANDPQTDSFDQAAPDGPLTVTFPLDGSAQFQSPESQASNQIGFGIDPIYGTFYLEVAKGQLAGYLVPDRDTHKVPSRDRILELGLEIDGASYGTARVVMTYHSTAGESGVGTYLFKSTGKEESGSLDITAGQIKELASAGSVAHSGILSGRLILPGGTGKDGTVLTLPTTGIWKFHLGEFSSASIDLGNAEVAKRVVESEQTITYKGAQGGVGDIQQFVIDRRSGVFTLKFNKIAAGVNGLGLPQAGSVKGLEDLGIQVDLYLALELVFESGPLNAARTFRMERINARSKAWLFPTLTKKPKKKPATQSTSDKIKDIIKDYFFPF